MGVAGSNYYGTPAADREYRVVTHIEAVSTETQHLWLSSGHRRAPPPDLLVNRTKMNRLMHDIACHRGSDDATSLNGSGHDEPSFPIVTGDMAPDRTIQLSGAAT